MNESEYSVEGQTASDDGQQTDDPVVRVVRRFDASPERVFDAFLDPDRASTFMFATESGQMVRAEIDARVGGSFAFVDRRDGEDVEHTGEYLEIDRPRRLVFTLSVDKSAADRVIIEIVPLETGCQLTLTHEMRPEWAEYASRTEEGWSGILDRLAATLGDRGGRSSVQSDNGDREITSKAEHTITMVRILDAPVDEVYAAWTDPAVMRRWMGTTVEADVRVGGRYRIESDADEGEVYVHTGEYLVLEPGRRIVQTFRAGRTEPDPNESSPYVNEFVEVRLRPLGPSQTELTLTNGWDGEGMTDEEQEAAKEGWTYWLDLLEGLFSHRDQTKSDYGVVTEPGTIRFERLLPGPIERVWAYLTESEKRGTWLASGAMDLRMGGRVELNFFHADLSPHEEPIPDKYRQFGDGDRLRGEITRCEPPRLLSYTWGDGSNDASEVTFELTPQDGKVLLVLTHRRLEDMVGVAAGWHTHLEILADRLNGREPHGFWSVHTPLEEAYEQRLAVQ